MSHLPRRRHEPALAKTRGRTQLRTCCGCAWTGEKFAIEEADPRCAVCHGTGMIEAGDIRKGDATVAAREQVRDTHMKFGRQPYD